jgi:hypothetical protein
VTHEQTQGLSTFHYPLEAWAQPVNGHTLSFEAKLTYPLAILSVNNKLATQALAEGILFPVEGPEIIETQLQTIAEVAEGLLRDYDHRHTVVLPYYGSCPIAHRIDLLMHQHGKHGWESSLISRKISNSDGMTTSKDKATIATPLPQKNPDGMVLVGDDVFDNLGSLSLIIEQMTGIDVPPKEISYLVDVMKEEQIVAGGLSVKNPEFWELLNRASKPQKNPWEILQHHLMQGTVQVDKQTWLMGSGLDTKIPMKDLIGEYPEIFQSIRIVQLIDELAQASFSFGRTIPGLVGVGNPQDFRRFVAQATVDYIKRCV